jgi:hypothetical protein
MCLVPSGLHDVRRGPIGFEAGIIVDEPRVLLEPRQLAELLSVGPAHDLEAVFIEIILSIFPGINPDFYFRIILVFIRIHFLNYYDANIGVSVLLKPAGDFRTVLPLMKDTSPPENPAGTV